jgi:hypothetical protein
VYLSIINFLGSPVLAFRSEAATTGEKDIKQQLDMQQLQEALKQIQTERDVRFIYLVIIYIWPTSLFLVTNSFVRTFWFEASLTTLPLCPQTK